MLLSLNWLRDYVDIDMNVDELCEKLTMLGLEIESAERQGDAIKDLFVGEILTMEPHPNADKLSICTTRIDDGEPRQIVCGAKNMKVGDKVPTVIVGGELPGGFKIAKRKMRGVESQGMMCSAKELGLGEDHDGLLILPADAPVGADARAVLGLDDVILEIEVTPNRGDWASMIGTARELAASIGTDLRVPDLALTEGSTPVADLSSVTVEDPDLCPRYIGRVIQGITIGPSPDWLARRLVAAGQRAINNVVDITNYVMLETGQPLHAFDYDKLAENRIVVRRAKDGETIKTIDQESHPLAADMLVIADAKAPVAVAGVMGGFDSEVGEGTVNIFLESAYFHPPSVRKTSRALNLISESSQRFQRGADPEMTEYAANRAAQLIVELAGGTLAAGMLDEYPKPLPRNEITLRFARTDALLGKAIAPTEQREILTSLGFELLEDDDTTARFRVPTWRHDASLEADLIEEVARLHGYGEIEATLPRIRHSEQVLAPDYLKAEQLRNNLVSKGLSEAIVWSFSSDEIVARAKLDGPYLDMVRLANPLSENQETMSTSLLPGLLQKVSENLRKTRQDIALFELGSVYHPGKGDEIPTQSPRLAILLGGRAAKKHWSEAEVAYDFYDIKGYAEEALAFLGINDAKFLEGALNCYAPGQRGEISVGGKPVGHLGEIAPEVREAFEIDHPVFALELNLAPLFARKTRTPQFQTVATFPPALRDLSVVVDTQVPAGDLCAAALKSGGKNLQRVGLFDIYTGKPIEKGKKSVALSLSFQSAERTLTDKDTQKACDKILRTLERNFGAALR